MTTDLLEVTPNFITEEEQAEILNWAVDQKDFCGRKTEGRYSGNINTLHNVPTLLDDIFERIVACLCFGDYELKKYRLVMHTLGAKTREHMDGGNRQYRDAGEHGRKMRQWAEIYYRGNVMVQNADEGGIFYHDGVPIEMPNRSLLNFTGKLKHYVTTVSKGERVILRTSFFPKG